MKILVTVDKFNQIHKDILKGYCEERHSIVYNNSNKKLSKTELMDFLKKEDPDIIIAGTEKYDIEVLNVCHNLKAISRVGIGVDAIDLDECEKRNIVVLNTPDAPTNAVVELTIGQIFNALRKIQETDVNIRNDKWIRYVGKDLSECTVGIIGHGRIGSLLANKLKGLVKNIYVNDIDLNKINGEVTSLEKILRESDIVTVHVPLTKENKGLISRKELSLLRDDCILINTSRGGIINEEDLYHWLSENEKATAAIDVFEEEPYNGKLISLKNCYLTSHIGSCTVKSRKEMELGAINNITEFLK